MWVSPRPKPAIAWCNTPLEAHSLAVAIVAEELYQEEWRRIKHLYTREKGLEPSNGWLRLAGLLHDVGKTGYTEHAWRECSRNEAPSFPHHEVVSALVASALALAAKHPSLREALRVASIAALLHHHGMGKAYRSLNDYIAHAGKALERTSGRSLEWAIRTGLEWLRGRECLFQGLGFGGEVVAAASRALEAPMIAPRAEKYLEKTILIANSGGDPVLVAASITTVAAVCVADTLVAGLERNQWQPSTLKWAHRLVVEKRGGLEDIAPLISRIKKLYPMPRRR